MRCSRLGLSVLALVALLATPSGLRAEDREDWQQRERVLADLGLRPGWRVADVGCGSGYFTFDLASAVGATGTVVAVDVSAKALDSVRDRIHRERVTNVEVVQSEARDTKINSSTLDAAQLCEVLHEMPQADRQPLVRDIARALKPGGFLFLIDWRQLHEIRFDPYEKLIPRDELVRVGTDAGLTLDAEFHYLKYQVFLRFRKPPESVAATGPTRDVANGNGDCRSKDVQEEVVITPAFY